MGKIYLLISNLIPIFIFPLLIFGCSMQKEISPSDLALLIESGSEINPKMETLHVLCPRYNRISQVSNTVIWEAPQGLKGYYRFNDSSDGTMYGTGNYPDEWKKAEKDNVIDMRNELPLVFYKIGRVQKINGKLTMVLPVGTHLIFKQPEPFSGANEQIIIKLPEIPQKADLHIYNDIQSQYLPEKQK